jgi:hypothetical protein
MVSDRQLRNERLFRDVNERIEEVSTAVPESEPIQFLCECGLDECTETVELTRQEYEAIHADPRHFITAPAHERDAGGVGVKRTRRYSVVLKATLGSEAS